MVTTTKKKATFKKSKKKPPHTAKKTTKRAVAPTTQKPALSKKAKIAKKKTRGVYGIPETLRDAALKVLDERKAENVVAVDARGRSALADYILVATGRSARQLAATADYLRGAFEKIGARRIRIEGLPQGDWVLVDAGDVIVHLFRPEVRTYYALDAIWAKSSGG